MLKLTTLALACVAMAGCTAAGSLLSSTRGSPQGGPREQRAGSVLDAQGLGVYLQVMGDLVEGDAVTQADVFQTVNNDAATAATTTNRLKLALALSIPGHPNSNPEHAQEELRTLLAQDQLLLPEERVLAIIQLRDVERRLTLDLEAQQTQIEAQRTIERQNSDAAQRISELERENRRLRDELEDARQTLEEITNIERSIRERESGPD